MKPLMKKINHKRFADSTGPVETLSKDVQGSNADHDHCYAISLPETSKGTHVLR